MKRAGLDYVKDLNLYVYENYEEFEQKNPGEYHFFTRYSHLCYTDPVSYTHLVDCFEKQVFLWLFSCFIRREK